MIVIICILQIKKLSCGEIMMCPQLTKPVTDVDRMQISCQRIKPTSLKYAQMSLKNQFLSVFR